MERTGTVSSTEKAGLNTCIIIKGLPEVREGQHLRSGDRVWTIVKKFWVRKPHVSVVLNHVQGAPGLPEQGDEVELMHDPVEGENAPTAVADLTVETVVRFEKKDTFVCCRGILAVKAGDVVTDGTQSWKVLDSSEGIPAAPGRTWLVLRASQGTHFDPSPNVRLLKKGG